MTFDDERRTLTLAYDWRDGRLEPVHPSIGRLLNHVLTTNGEDAVPFGHSTNGRAPSLVDLIRSEYRRAPAVTSSDASARAHRFADQMRTSVHKAA